MVQIKILLDKRRLKSGGTYSIIFRITNVKKVYTITSGISIEERLWDEGNREIFKTHPNAQSLNTTLSSKYYKIQKIILKLEEEGGFSYDKLKLLLFDNPNPVIDVTFKAFSQKLIAEMIAVKRTGNAIVYQTAVNRFLNFCNTPKIKFTEINYSLLDQFSHHLALQGLKQNSIGNYFRSLRAIYNKAIKANLVERAAYPFFNLKIKTERTTKRAVTRKEIQQLEDEATLANQPSRKALNYFLLSFYLIGISFTDLAYLTQDNLVDGRVEYRRRKTHKNYSVKLYPQAEIIIKSLQVNGAKYLLPILSNDTPEDSLSAKQSIHQWIKRTNKQLKKSGTKIGVQTLTTYVARHTFATTAKKLGYSNELIAEALGHEYGNKVTNIYLDNFDKEVVDEMHKRVIS